MITGCTLSLWSKYNRLYGLMVSYVQVTYNSSSYIWTDTNINMYMR